jgi:hypothetical protein
MLYSYLPAYVHYSVEKRLAVSKTDGLLLLRTGKVRRKIWQLIFSNWCKTKQKSGFYKGQLL